MLNLLSADRMQRLRDVFRDANFSDAEFHRNPMLRELPSRRAGNGPYLLECTREPSTLNLLLRWFFMGERVDSRLAAGLFTEPVLALLLEAGMLAPQGDLLRPEVMLSPCDEYLFAADPMSHMASRPSDVVLWPNQTTRLLQQFAIPKHAQSTLDLGAGCGVLSVLLSAQSGRVCATDLNARAAEFTSFNARFNHVENIEIYTGDTFEPLGDQKFDLIVANPPFFVSPSSERMFCENPMELDGYCRRVAREAAARLNEGGYFQMICEWVEVAGQPWTGRLAEWVDGSGCDTWVGRTYHNDAAAYALERTRDEYAISPETTALKYAEWMAYYRDRKVKQIHGGLFAMRKRTGQNWFRCEDAVVKPGVPFGDSVVQLFETQDTLAARRSDDELALLKPRLAPAAKLEQDFHLHEGEWAQESAKLTLSGGLPASHAVELPVAHFLARCNGRNTLGDLAQQLARQVQADPSQVRQQCCAAVRKLALRRLIYF